MLNCAVIGYGYWGPNFVRNFMDNPEIKLSYVCDLDASRLNVLKQKNLPVKTTTDYKEILRDDSVELVAIATPVSSHYPIAKDALKAGKHVLVEKPMTAKVAHAEDLIELAARKNRLLFVDHTFIYTGAVKKMKELITGGAIGDIYYFDSVRVNLGLFQHDINVIWDLAPHDLSIMDYLIEEKPVAVSALGFSRVHGKLEDIAYVTVKFEHGLIAHFHVNWMSPVKIRKIIVGGNKKMVVFDDLEPDEKVKIYDKGVTVNRMSKDKVYKNLVQYRIGDMHSPSLERGEALKVEIAHAAECIGKNKKPITDGEAGLRVVRLLEASEKSIKKGGAFVKI